METERFNTVVELMDEAFRQYGPLPAFTCMGQSLSYAELDSLSRKFASFVQNHTSLKVGDRVASQLPNLLQ